MENEETTSANQPLVEMRAITKTFQNVIANNCVDLSVNRGEIHALLGENGAGKSTLMNVLYGLYAPDSGEIYLNGEKIIMKSPADAIAKGIGMIHQEFMLIPTLSVIENIILCMKSDNALKLDLQKAAKCLVDLSSRFGLDIDPWAKVSQLSVGEQQRVEILKAFLLSFLPFSLPLALIPV
ncbi:MAG TPA: ATP-binding cassette domain-containing protein [Flexilinea sp.]|nr:ATP-binding cassette domain-containing protein [Flexilinea sp.]